MNISKRKQGILAIICTIAMIVTSITVYNPREVKADADYSKLTYNYKNDYKKDGEAFMKGSGDKKSPWKVAIDASQSKGDIVNWMTKGDGHLTFYGGMFMRAVWYANYSKATLEINGVKVERGGAGVGTFDENEIHVNAKEWINNNAYNVVKVTSADGSQYVTFIVATGDKAVTSSEETTTRNPSVVDWKGITNGSGYSYNADTKVHVDSVQKPPFASEQGIYMTVPNTIESVIINGVDSKKYARQGAGVVVYLSGLVKGENTININYVGGEETVIIKNENEVVTTPETDERTGNIVQGKIWKAYTSTEGGKFYEISSDATNYTLLNKNIGSTWWNIQTMIEGVTLYANTEYVCTFTLKADKPKAFTVDNQKDENGTNFVESNGKGWQKAEDGTYFYKYKGIYTNTNKQDFNLRVSLGYHAENDKKKMTDSNYSANDIATFKMSNFQIVKASEYKDDTYIVSINGTKVGSAEPDNTYTLPTEAKYGYYDTVNKKIYKAGSKITVNEDVTLVSITNVSVKMYDGAAIRIAANKKTPGGIRFKASVDVTCGVAEYKNEITNKVQAGTLITTKDILDAKKDVEYNVENVNNIGKVLDVENTGWLDEDTHSYSASLINIVKANYDRYFVAKAYVKVPYVKATAEYVYSADDSGNSCANSVKRSISDVAKAIKGNNEYDGITDDTIKKLIDSFIVTK